LEPRRQKVEWMRRCRESSSTALRHRTGYAAGTGFASRKNIANNNNHGG
jgi:hypothetical protein